MRGLPALAPVASLICTPKIRPLEMASTGFLRRMKWLAPLALSGPGGSPFVCRGLLANARLWSAELRLRQLEAMLLEDRVLLNAAPVDAALSDGGGGQISAAPPAPISPGDLEAPVEIAFIDSAAGDANLFFQDLQKQAEAGRNLEVVLLDASRDGLTKITEVLVARNDAGLAEVDAIHILAHGNERALRLGNDWLRADGFDAHLETFAAWNAALADGGDVLFYSCDLAANNAGQSMLHEISLATGGDVAASTDNTGGSALGGDWELEFSTGTIDVGVAVSLEAQADFAGLLATFTVTNTNDSGAGSLRQAILDANASGGTDIIDFNIPLNDAGHFYYRDDGAPGSLSLVVATTLADAAIGDFDPDYPAAPYSWYSISLASSLPTLSDAVILDGTTQPGFAGYPVIELDGGGVGGHGLEITAGGTTIRGLVINQFGSNGIQITSGDGNTIQGNFIGTDVSGTIDLGNGTDGIDARTDNNVIGGTTAAQRNILSGNQDDGIDLDGASSNMVLGNYIGVDFTGLAPLGNSSDGILVASGSFNNTIGGTAAGEGNVIAGNGGIGVSVTGGVTGNSIRGNSIYSNAGLGIDLAGNGVTSNDPNDADGGDNNRQNFPVITSAVTNGLTTTITGTLNSTASTTYDLDFYANTAGDGSGHGEGETYLGSDMVTTDGTGNANFTVVLTSAVSSGAIISSTATDPSDNTSEFGANVAATSDPEATDDAQDFNSVTTALGPVGYWRLGESAGTTAADDAGGNSGTYNGPTLAQAGALAGDADTAVSFNSSDNDYIEIPHSPAYLLDSGSIQLWFNTSTPAQDGALFSKDHSGLGSGGHLTMWLDGAGLLQVRLQSDTGDNVVSSAAAVSADQWHHVVFTFGKDSMRLYLNGQLIDSDAYTGGLGATSGGAGNFEPIAIGAGARNSGAGSVTPLNQFYDGLIDEVAIFDAALTPEQVQNLYAAGLTDYTVAEGGTLNVAAVAGVLANDFDPEGDPLMATLIAGPSNAVAFTLNPDGSFSYTHDGGETLTDTFTYEADDGSTTSNVATVTITITPANDAPVLDNTGDMTLADVAEDDANPSGDMVAAIIASAGGDRITDVDAGAVEGIAVTGVDDTNGQWQYNTGGGWLAFGAVANNSAVLLDTTASIRFVPTADYNGLAGNISFRAWDQTDANLSGDIGIDVSTNGGTTAYSTATETATLSVTAANDAPVLDNTGAMTLTDVAEDDANPTGNTVSSIIASAGGDRITDVDAGAVEGIAVTGVDDTNGQWQYNTGGGWLAFGAVANNSAVLLDPTAAIRFVPTADYNGSAGNITFRAWDQTDANLSGDIGIDVSTNGGTTAYSTATETATLNVTAANDSPVLDNTGNMTLTDVAEDDTNPTGNTVSSIIASAGGDRITDVDAGAVEGIAVTGVDDTNGQWQYNTGGGWLAFGAVANNSTVLLDPTAAIRFVPTADYNGSAGNITFRAWDQTDGNLSGDIGIDVATNGGTTAYSTATEMATLNVTAANDSPVLDNTGNMTLTDVAEDDTNPTGNTVSSIIASAGGDRISDVDAGAVEGIAVTGVDDTNGQWQYNTGGGWLAFGAVANNSAVLLDTTASIRFVPTADYNGSAGNITFRAWDQTDSNLSGDVGIDVSTNGGTTAYSTATETATLSVTAANDAPVLDNTGAMTLTDVAEDDANPTGDTVSSIIASAGGDRISDVDAGAVEGIAVTGVDDTNGQWQYNTGGGWLAFGAVANNSAVLLDTTASVRFVPSANYNGSVGNITFRAWDQTDANLSGDVGIDISTSGGATAYSTAMETATLNINAVNDVPVNTLPAPQTTNENTPLTLSAGNGNQLLIADVDAGGNAVEVNLGVTSGVLSLAQTTGLNFSTGDGTTDASMTFTGTTADVNAALNGLIYSPNVDYSGPDGIAITTNDLGNSGGPPQSDADVLAISVSFVGTAPVAQGDTAKLFGFASLTVTASGVLSNDVDPDGQPLTASLVSGPQNGSLTLNSDGSYQYVPVAEFVGFDSFQYTASDGILTSAPATVTILVVPGVGAPPESGSGDSNDNNEESLVIDPDAGEDAQIEIDLGDDESVASVYLVGSTHSYYKRSDGAVATLEELVSEEIGLLNAEVDEFLAAEGGQSGRAKAGAAGGRGAAGPGGSGSDADIHPGTLGALSESLRFDAGLLFERLNDLEKTLTHETAAAEWIIGTAASTTTVLTAGYVVWLVRGGYLFAGLLSSMPTWYRLDPLPVLESGGFGFSGVLKKNDDRGESLVEIVDEEHFAAGGHLHSGRVELPQRR